MSTARNFTARMLIWLAAFMLPVQGLLGATCGCGDASSCGSSRGCCCSADDVREGTCCCAGKQDNTGHSCCSAANETTLVGSDCCGAGTACTCGPGCHCGQPPQSSPSTPPVENDTAEKAGSESTVTPSVAIIVVPRVERHDYDGLRNASTLAAVDRCVSLCRFTL